MSGQPILEPVAFFASLGGLHDAVIDSMQFLTNESSTTLVLTIDDLNAAFFGLPEYEGLRAADIVLLDVVDFFVDLEVKDDDVVWIGAASVSEPIGSSRPYRLEIDVAGPGGKITKGRAGIAATFAAMEVRDKSIG